MGNVSGINRSEGFVVIKPSGIAYEDLKLKDMVIVDLDGKIVEGNLRPSSDTKTHLELYKAFPEIVGITHNHSMYATMFAQVWKEIVCYGTTNSDAFFWNIPVTRFLSKEEVNIDFEKNTGKVIIERFQKINPSQIPAVLVAGHAPFAWGKTSLDSVKNAQTLEAVAQMAVGGLH